MKVSTLLFFLVLCTASRQTIETAAAQDTHTQPLPSMPTANSLLPEGLPDEFGVYLKTDRGWQRLHQNSADKTEMKRGGFTQWTGIGVGGLHMKVDYRGSQAILQF